MKKSRVLLLSAAIGLTLTACGSPKEVADTTSDSTTQAPSQGQDKPQTDSQVPEDLPASQEYVSVDGTYQVTLLEGLTQTDMQLQVGSSMMGLDGGSDRVGFSGVSVGSPKANIPGNPDGVESLEDYADYMADMVLDGSGVTVNWEDTDAPSTEGAERCLARKGVAKSGASKGQAYAYYVETADCYYSVVIVGNNDDVDEAVQVLALEVLDTAAGQRGTTDFLNSMTAVLDSVNGASVRETFKMLEDMGADADQLDTLASQARESLSASWEVENTEDLMETADWLMTEGHNKNALELLDEFGGKDAADRDAFEAELKEQNLDEGIYVSLLAAYDAWSAYGDGAVAAWDLSRVGTIMGFGYAAGYCTYEEAMDKMLETAQKAQELFDSWEDFNDSYLYGYSYWAEESLEDAESSAGERAALVDGMESQANGPFSVDWNMELKKEW